MTDQTIQPATARGPAGTRHHVECVTDFARSAYGDMSDSEILRRLLDLRDRWNAGTLTIRQARAVALLFIERGRRLDARDGAAV